MNEKNTATQLTVAEPVADRATVERINRVAEAHGVEGISTRLSAFTHWLKDDLTQLDHLLGHVVVDPSVDVAWRAAEYLLDRPGKRMRPLCVMLASRMLGRADTDAVLRAAAAAELVHAATLLHDDVIDQGDERRGQPTARLVFGNAASVLGGDHLLIEALKRVDGLPDGILASLLDVIAGMVSAEALQLEARNRVTPDRTLYMRVVEGKTAALFRWALTSGARLGGLPVHDAERLGEVGHLLGVTFQLIDDLLDLTGNPEITGKGIALDLIEGKLTWPIILAAERSASVLGRLKAISAAKQVPSPDETNTLVALIEATGAIDETRTKASQYAARAQGELEHLPQSPSRDALSLVINKALEREF
ncbi:MAG: polyprenyl synthetase family protein [Myxococcota bacterium]|nr:polyprenyl synthetase family protein [Myxococcota bacterium]